MPRGPQGQKRLGDVMGNAITVAQIATSEIQDTKTNRSGRGKADAVARAKSLIAEDRAKIAKKAAAARWK